MQTHLSVICQRLVALSRRITIQQTGLKYTLGLFKPPPHTSPVHTYLQLLSFSCAALIYCVRTLAAFSAHYVHQTLISNSETLVCAIAILAAALSGLWRSRQCLGNVLECPLTFKVLGVVSSLLGQLCSHLTSHASLIPPHLDTSHLTPHASHLTPHICHPHLTPHLSHHIPCTLLRERSVV